MVYTILLILFMVLLFSSFKITNNTNTSYLDIKNTTHIKGLCALLITIHHLAYDMNNLFILYEPIKYIGFILVSLFFFFSGYGLMNGLLNKKDYLKGFISKRLLFLLLPYLIVIICYYCIILFQGQSINIFKFIYMMLFAKRLGATWFVTAIMTLYIMFYIIFSNFNIKKGTNIFLWLIIIYVIISSIINIPSQWFSSIIGFWYGLYYKNNEEKLYNKLSSKYTKNLFTFLFLFVTLFVSRLVISMFVTDTELLHGVFRNVISILFITSCLLLFMKIKFNNNVLLWFGSISYEIYLVHPFILSILKSFNYGDSIHVILSILLTIIFAYILNKFSSIIKKIQI